MTDVRDLVRANAELALAAVAERLVNVSGPLTLDELRAVGVEAILERYGRACAKAALDAYGVKVMAIVGFGEEEDEITERYPAGWVKGGKSDE